MRQRVYIYASPTPGDAEDWEAMKMQPGDLPVGVLVGTVEIRDCTGQPGDYEWHLAKADRLTRNLTPKKHPQPMWFYPSSSHVGRITYVSRPRCSDTHGTAAHGRENRHASHAEGPPPGDGEASGRQRGEDSPHETALGGQRCPASALKDPSRIVVKAHVNFKLPHYPKVGRVDARASLPYTRAAATHGRRAGIAGNVARVVPAPAMRRVTNLRGSDHDPYLLRQPSSFWGTHLC
jgi:hypothetical protein